MYSWRYVLAVAAFTILATLIYCNIVKAEEFTASWYSVASLKAEGTYKYSKGIMANGKEFKDDNFTCATRMFPLGTILRICSLSNSKSILVVVTDKIGKRFATKRIDLSRSAMEALGGKQALEAGLLPVKVERVD